MDTNFFHLQAETPPLEDGPDPDPDEAIDLLNHETFGSSALEEDWEDEHEQFVVSKNSNTDLSSSHNFMNEDELEISNQQLAAAVEELVLKSDQDQDAIDPAIVSLRKESRPNTYRTQLDSDILSPYLNSDISSSSDQTYFLSDGMRSIWGKSPQNVPGEEYGSVKSPLDVHFTKKSPSPIEDAAIVTAVKSKPRIPNWNQISSNNLSAFLNQSSNACIHKGVLRAEDLEKEFNAANEVRTPSPTFGISIPKYGPNNQEHPLDRSLPARSVSPVIGSPPAHEMPIGTPPNRLDSKTPINNQRVNYRMPPHGARIPPGMQGSQAFMIPRGRGGPPRLGMSLPPQPWPPYPSPRSFPNQRMDMIHRMEMSRNFPMHHNGRSPSASPVGSPRFGSGPMPVLRPGMPRPFPPNQMHPNFANTPPRSSGFPPDNRFMPPPPRFSGPGHLHPEHRRFVYMQQQQRNKRFHNNHRNRNNYSGRNRRDPYSDLMTQKEKDWVIKIQMMALQSDRPEIDDYYYQNYIERQLQRGGLSLDNENSKNKRLLTPTKANPEHKKYIPVQFKDSLGKLTVSSVYNPRQVIDVVHKSADEEQSETNDSKQASSKRFEIFKIVEKAYDNLMIIEENNVLLEKPNISPERKLKLTKEINSSKEVLVDLLKINSKTINENNDVITHMFLIRKGKRLMARILPYLEKNNALDIVLCLSKNLTLIIKRDIRDDILSELYNPMVEFLEGCHLDHLVQIALNITPILNHICKECFGLSFICKLLCLGHKQLDEQNEASDNGKSWRHFVKCSAVSILALFGEAMKPTSVNLIDKSIAHEIVEVLQWNEEKLLDEGNKNRELAQNQIKTAAVFFSTLLQDNEENMDKDL